MARKLTITCNSSHGLMRCASCHRKIETDSQGFARKPYGYYETSAAYVVFHRECTASNDAWTQYDKIEDARVTRNRELLAAAIDFRDKWGVDVLDELIEDLS